MSILMKVVAWVGGVVLILGSICVTIAALFPPKEYKGDGKTGKSSVWDESIEDV